MPWTVSDVEQHKSGLTQQQKERWVKIANSVMRRCMADGGTDEMCAPRAIRQANGMMSNNSSGGPTLHGSSIVDYEIRNEQHQGRDHWVIPVVMMVEGVHHGSHGPLLYTADELGKFPNAWNGIPVVIYHPQDNQGNNVSANAPDVLDREEVGRVFNATFEEGKLKGECWIDFARLEQVSPTTYEYIKNHHPLDVSVGVFTDDDAQEGTWNGEHYQSIARNYRPDHLAILPDQEGACNFDDGCGIRSNTNKGGEPMKEGTITLTPEELRKTKGLVFETGLLFNLKSNEAGYIEIFQKIQGMINAMDNDMRVYYLEEVFEDHIIYRTQPRGNSGGEPKLYKRNYTKNNDGSIELAEEIQEVRKNTEFIPVEPAANKSGSNFNKNNVTLKQIAKMKQNDCAPCKAKIDALISNKASGFAEEDREMLEALSEQQLDKLAPKAEAAPAVQVNGKEKETAPAIDEKVLEGKIKEILSNEKEPEKFIDKFFPSEVGEQLKSGLKMHQNRKAELIKGITENSEFKAEDLAGWSMDQLEKLNKSVVKETADFSLNASGKSRALTIDEDEANDMLYANKAVAAKTPEKK